MLPGVDRKGRPEVVVGTHMLLPNMPNQAIQIFVTGDGNQVAGMDFVAQVGDGGPTNACSSGPGCDRWSEHHGGRPTGTPFASNHNPTTDPAGGGEGTQTVYTGVTTQSGTVAASGLIGTIFV